MSEQTDKGQSGGVTISGSVGSINGDIVGRDKIGTTPPAQLDTALAPLVDAIRAAAPAENLIEAETKLSALRLEASKGKSADDGVIAKLVDGLVGLVPGAASAVVSAFATPIMGSIIGPVTGFVLSKLQGQ